MVGEVQGRSAPSPGRISNETWLDVWIFNTRELAGGIFDRKKPTISFKSPLNEDPVSNSSLIVPGADPGQLRETISNRANERGLMREDPDSEHSETDRDTITKTFRKSV
ncbi:unnamed protein product [Aspergillus oryzae]|nr:unnamed protein product [Aspergillus oryzae]